MVVISVISGPGGIGKTWLALHWAHQEIKRFPDGQLFVDLRGFTPAGKSTPVAVAIRGFLDALGVEPARIPVEFDAQVGLYRSLVAGRRMLIVLDNAYDTAQIAPLLPGSPSCTVLVTSRRHLYGLATVHGARLLDLDMLSTDEARQILADRLGAERLAAEPGAVTELLECCAGLPLALSIVAARAIRYPNFPLRVLVEELRDHATRLDGLDAGEIPLNLRAVFSWSYNALSPEAATLFGLLGLVPGSDIGLPAAASLIGLPVAEVRGLLRELETAHLVIQSVPGRYRMHDLILLDAADQARRHQPGDLRDAALRRLVDFYLHTAYSAERLLAPHRRPIEIGIPEPGYHPHSLPDQEAAWVWFDVEYPCLLAAHNLTADRGWHAKVWQLAWTLGTFYLWRGHLRDRLTVWQAGLAAAQHQGDSAILLLAHRRLGRACADAGRHDEAFVHLNRALALACGIGDLLSQAQTYAALAWTWGQRRDDQQALAHATSALCLFQALDQPVWEAEMHTTVGWFSARLGRHQQASTHSQAALTLFRRHDCESEVHPLITLGYVAHHTGRHDQALHYYQQALTLIRHRGHTYTEAVTLNRLGQTYAALGEHDQARHVWRQALRLYQDQHRTIEVDRLRRHLAAYH